MDVAARRRDKEEEEGASGEKMEMSERGALPLPSFIAGGRPTAGLHDPTQ
jgi:hypothetical protein